MRWTLPAALGVLILAAVAWGIADGGEEDRRPANRPTTQREHPEPDGRPRAPAADIPLPECPDDLPNCVAAKGTIIFLERRDPDGDGDAHFVLASRASVSGPGITIVDVRRDLRPRPLPGIGQGLAAAGPVRRGSYSQAQIEAIDVNVAP